MNLPFNRSGDILLTKYQELAAKGYPPQLIEGSLRRCVGWARRLADKMPEDIREEAFTALLHDNLSSAEEWIVKFREKVTV